MTQIKTLKGDVDGVYFADPETGLPVGNGGQIQAIPDLEDAADIAAAWGNFDGVNTAGGDFVTSVSGLNGQAIIAMSASPLTTGESVVVNTQNPVLQPAAMEIAASFVRTGISFATASLFANASVGADPVPAPINIVSCYQSGAVLGAAYNAIAGTVMHMTLASPLPAVGLNNAVYAGDWINITGLVDNRLNYPNACINYISPDRTVIAVGFSDEAVLPSLAVPVITPTPGTAQVNFYNNMSGARNGFGLRLTGTTATSAAIVSIFGGDDNQVSGTLMGDHRVTIGTTAPTYVAGSNIGSYEIRASTRFMLECGLGASTVLDKGEQANAQWTQRDTPRTSVKPASGARLLPRFRLFKPVSMSRPIAKIVSAVKTGTTTATVTTDAPHGLVTGNWVTVKGARDVTNFAPITTPVQVTVTGANTFTIVWGGAVNATTYGGSVVIANGGRDQPGIVAQTVSSVVSRVAADGNWLDVIGNTTWAGMNRGDYVDLHGVRTDLTGEDLGLDGAWEVADLNGTLMVLRPIFNIFGVRVSPALGTLASTNCGGAVIIRPTLRSHDLSVRYWSETVIGIDGQGTTRLDKAMPAAIVSGNVGIVGNPVLGAGANAIGTVGIANGQGAEDAAIAGNAVRTGGRVRTSHPITFVANDAADVTITTGGAQVVKPYSVTEADWNFTGALTATTDVVVQAAAGAGLKRHVTLMQATNTGAAAVDVLLRDGTTTRLQITVPAGQAIVLPIPTGMVTTANTALNVALSAVGTVRVNILGYTAP